MVVNGQVDPLPGITEIDVNAVGLRCHPEVALAIEAYAVDEDVRDGRDVIESVAVGA